MRPARNPSRWGGVVSVGVECRAFTWKGRDRDPGPYTTAIVSVGKRKVELTASPTERTFYVHVDGVKYVPEAAS